MRLIPNVALDTKSPAEYRTFDQLKEAFAGQDHYYAFHSLNLPDHQSKRSGEIDFLILCEHGLFVLEIKGGRINIEDGVWKTTNKNNDTYDIQDPFRQAKGAMHALLEKIKKDCVDITPKFTSGFGVVLPDVEWTMRWEEWNSKQICDARHFKNFEGWLSKLFKYFREKPGNDRKLNNQELTKLRDYIRPSFELVQPLHSKLYDLQVKAEKLTEDQYRCLDIAQANSRVLCEGGAGTGKTFLAVELVRRFDIQDKKVALVCKSPWLKNYLASNVLTPNSIISTVSGLKTELKRKDIDKLDVLVVDEGQDLFNETDLDVLDNSIDGGLEKGSWYIFHDINNQANIVGETDPEYLTLLEDYAPTKIPLKTNCRNTANIVNYMKASLNVDTGILGTGDGPEVIAISSDNKNPPQKILEEKIDKLKQSIDSGYITILSKHEFKKSSARFLPDHIKKHIAILDDHSVRNTPFKKLTFATVKNFKGLENEVIIVIDLEKPRPSTCEDSQHLNYVAMSRAKALLYLIY